MSYRPTTYKYAGVTKTLYVIYKFPQKLRNGRIQLRTKVKRFYVSGTNVSTYGPAFFTNRKGKRIYGIKVTYRNPIKAFVAHRGKTSYRQPKKTLVVSKIIPLPREVRNVRISSTAPKGPLMEVA